MTAPTHYVVQPGDATGQHANVQFREIPMPFDIGPTAVDADVTVWAEYDGADDATHAKEVHVQLDAEDGQRIVVHLNDTRLYAGDPGEDENAPELIRQAMALMNRNDTEEVDDYKDVWDLFARHGYTA